MLLAASAFFAIRHAVEAARKDHGLHDNIRFDSPATAERIRMTCQDFLTDKVGEDWKEITIRYDFERKVTADHIESLFKYVMLEIFLITFSELFLVNKVIGNLLEFTTYLRLIRLLNSVTT